MGPPSIIINVFLLMQDINNWRNWEWHKILLLSMEFACKPKTGLNNQPILHNLDFKNKPRNGVFVGNVGRYNG